MHPPSEAFRLVVGADRLALCGRLPRISHHHHATAAIVVGIDRPLGFQAGRAHWSTAALLAPGFSHAVEVNGGRMAVFLLSPSAVDASSLGPLRDLPHPGRWVELGRALLDGQLTDFEPVSHSLQQERLNTRPVDPRLHDATERIARTLRENTSIEELAAEVGLSPSRLMALCREQLGTSFRSYRRWLRTFEVARRFASGASLTEAAYLAGFSSSAHLSIAAREHFGLRPSHVLNPANRAGILSLG